MNTVLTYLRENWERLHLEQYGSSDRISSVINTPRFHASGHIIFFILTEGRRDAILVVKVPRIAGDNERLDREAHNLRKVQLARPDGFDSIPRVLDYEDWLGNKLLTETALDGQPMKPGLVRKHPSLYIEIVMSWLVELNQETRIANRDSCDWFDRLALQPLNTLISSQPSSSKDVRLWERSPILVDPLRHAPFPLVFEHGDLSSPNILIRKDSQISVVDWELAEPNGLPAVDFFFFLTYVAFAKTRARDNKGYIDAFDQAFFGRDPWTLPYLRRYARSIDLSLDLLKPLFLLYLGRYVSNLVWRLGQQSSHDGGLPPETLTWLRTNRYYALWEHTLSRSDQLLFS